MSFAYGLVLHDPPHDNLVPNAIFAPKFASESLYGDLTISSITQSDPE
ncbi:hypothetical protein OAE37_02725 [Pirellulaceae bacterium]|nr:hypothetical protein [Pirellulaceae bacterium]